MGWREDMIERYRSDIAQMSESIDMMEDGLAKIGEVAPSGKVTDMSADLIAHYRRTISMLEDVIAKLESKDY